MRIIVGILIIFLFTACLRSHSVQVSGRVETSDTVVSFRVNDQLYHFRLDEKHYFSGKIELEKGAYAVFLPSYVAVFLTPGEDLEINYNTTRGTPNSLQYKGTLSAINNYLKDQYRFIVSFDNNFYELDEKEFVDKMNEMININILLLEAKNLGEEFTNLERERIRYRVAEQAMYYPNNHHAKNTTENYKSGTRFDDFISSFDINNEDLLSFSSYRYFVLNYIYCKGRDLNIRNLVDYILTNVNSLKVRDYLLSEVVFTHFRENGLRDSDYLLSICWNEVSDTSKMVKIKQVVDRWRRLSTGATAPDILLMDAGGQEVQLKDFKGDYLYITVWVPGYGDAWDKEHAAWEQLTHDYKGKKIRFMTFVLNSDPVILEKYKNIPGEHFVVKEISTFYNRYMLSMLPRYILIDANGRIVDANAPNPSGSAKLLLGSIGL